MPVGCGRPLPRWLGPTNPPACRDEHRTRTSCRAHPHRSCQPRGRPRCLRARARRAGCLRAEGLLRLHAPLVDRSLTSRSARSCSRPACPGRCRPCAECACRRGGQAPWWSGGWSLVPKARCCGRRARPEREGGERRETAREPDLRTRRRAPPGGQTQPDGTALISVGLCLAGFCSAATGSSTICHPGAWLVSRDTSDSDYAPSLADQLPARAALRSPCRKAPRAMAMDRSPTRVSPDRPSRDGTCGVGCARHAAGAIRCG